MVKKLLEQFKAKFNDKERVSLLEMSQLIKEKKFAEAEKLLNDISKSSSKVVKYYLIQTLLLQGKLNEAVQVFKELDEYKTYKLGIV
jgi:thioredoxin-like negative regulator of GroEL